MPHKPFFPRADADALLWMTNFVRQLNREYRRYGVDDAQRLRANELRDAFAALVYRTTTIERTRETTRQKNEARTDAERWFRGLAARLKADPDLTRNDRILLGLGRPAGGRGPRLRPPTTSPDLAVREIGVGFNRLSWVENGLKPSFTPVARGHTALPRGAAQVQLFAATGDRGDDALPSRDEARFLRAYTRTPFRVYHEPRDRGRAVTYWARYATRRGEAGPFGFPLQLFVN